jgi:outer membrane protein insertion porin family
MNYKIIKFFLILLCVFITNISIGFSEVLKKIEVSGNERISTETIKVFIPFKLNDQINENDINLVLKNLYETNFFKDVKVLLENNQLNIFVIENPIIQNINYNGVKAKKVREPILKNLKLKQRSSYNKIFLQKDKDQIILSLKQLGYYFSTIEVVVEELEDNKVNINFDIDLGEKAKIEKISFIGNKIYKDRKLRRVILSEEYKPWKFISGKKFLNENLIEVDGRLLKNFYLNRGFYDVKINSSFAKLIDDNEFQLIYNIDAGNKVFFNELNLELPPDYISENFNELKEVFLKLKGEPYSINSLNKILDKIDIIALNEQYESIRISVNESLVDNNLNLTFIIDESDKFFVERINILGNNVTQESVIRNQLELDEGDPYNEILNNKSVNNIKNLNFFKSVKSKVKEGSIDGQKVIDVFVEEKPTGEITASAGVGTSGTTFGAGISEKNFLGRGLSLNSNLLVGEDSIRGLFSVQNPNFLDSDKSIYTTIESSETDKLTDYGYKTSKSGFSFGTSFEYYDDLRLGLGNSNFYEKIETDSTASARQKSQEGDYWDSFLKLDFDYDKRNQKFQTSDGFRSFYSLDIPIVSETNTLKNVYNYKYFTELYEENVSTVSLYFSAVNSLSNDDVKLSERINIPSSKLRGFQFGRVGPKDGNDYIGGNYISTLNISSTLPQLLENSQNTDFLIFLDIANVWGVDYDSSLDDSNTIRSAAGVGVDWFTPIGPLNFSLSQPITKANTDKTETFRFNLGTTF